MKVTASFLAFVNILLLVVADRDLWQKFKRDHGKTYAGKQEASRYEIFKHNLKNIEEHNTRYRNGEVRYYLGITPFCDWSPEEYVDWLKSEQDYSGTDFEIGSFNQDNQDLLGLPTYIDWRDQEGVVWDVPEAVDCMASWAFSAIGAIEGQNALRNNRRRQLSTQEVVDCADHARSSTGCNAGSLKEALNFILKRGILEEDIYPWRGSSVVTCKADYSSRYTLKIKKIEQVSQNNQAVQMALAYIGPMSALLDASHIQLYKGGVYEAVDCLYTSKTSTTHGVLLVGYDSVQRYWLVRNSWGTSWGENGYIKVTMSDHYNCGVTQTVLYPKFS